MLKHVHMMLERVLLSYDHLPLLSVHVCLHQLDQRKQAFMEIGKSGIDWLKLDPVMLEGVLL